MVLFSFCIFIHSIPISYSPHHEHVHCSQPTVHKCIVIYHLLENKSKHTKLLSFILDKITFIFLWKNKDNFMIKTNLLFLSQVDENTQVDYPDLHLLQCSVTDIYCSCSVQWISCKITSNSTECVFVLMFFGSKEIYNLQK